MTRIGAGSERSGIAWRSRVCALLVAAGFALAGELAAQDESPATPAPPAEVQPPNAAAPAPSAAPSKRAKALGALKYDRRPSTILATRAKPAGAETTMAPPASPSGAPPEVSGGEFPSGFFAVDTGGGTTVTYTAGGGIVVTTSGGTFAPGPAVAPAAAPAPVESASSPDAPPAADEAAAKKAADAAEAKAIQTEGAALQRDVTLGDWKAVDAYLAGLAEADGKAGYERLVASLVEGPPRVQSPFANWAERNFFAVDDIAGLIAAAPVKLDKARLTALGTLARQCVDNTGLVDPLLVRLRAALAAGELGIERAQLAAILIAAGYPVEAGEFLPPLEEAVASDDRVTLNLIARHCLAQNEKDKKVAWLEQAWHALQAVLALGTVDEEDKAEALQRAVEVAPRVRAELGEAWLAESFSTRPERGLEILSAIGGGASRGLVDQARNPDYRLRSLQLQHTAAEALLADAPELAAGWSDTLSLLAGNWLHEAEYSNQFDTSTSRGPAMQRDAYGNIYYYDAANALRNNPNQPLPLKTTDVLANGPSDAWLARVETGLRPRVERATAQLLLKLGDERAAFPHIELLARVHPVHARELAEEFLRVWIRNHNPNDQQQRTNPYMYMYGFEQRQSGIPLTRSKQERNLEDLAGWIARLKALPIAALDEELVARAFTSAHSSAEVYRLETIEKVFGPLGELGPKTLAELVQTMRTNLAGVWREPAQQEDKKTRRRPQDIQAEVLRGYEVARTVVERALAEHADDWSLLLARAAVLHDENDYHRELARSSDYAPHRAEAFAAFARAAERYADVVETLDAAEQSSRVYELWFYAALGACDLDKVSHEQPTAEDEMPKIRAAIEALPGEAAARHADLFANTLFTRMSNVQPAVKYRYVRHGLEIVPASERTRDARAVFEYYRDLVTEIRLEARLEGEARVGQEPFGVFVDLRHTREIEREAGGFAKYLVNQNTQNFSYNYGRPTEDYRDKFESAARAALEEHFEILSVTFNVPETHSRALEEYGWRVTPYAYLLLKAKSPAVDRLPPLRLDLDFNDTTGYAVLPIESAPLSLDATGATARPFRELALVQTLDERQAKDGKLLLEVQAKGKGLVPPLEQVLELAPPGFVQAGVEDQGVSVTQFDQEGEGIDVLSERTWLVTLRSAEDLAELPAEFRFGTARVAGAKLTYQRYVDADLASVGPVVPLEQRYGEPAASRAWVWAVAALVVLGGGAFAFVRARRSRRTERGAARFRVPEPLTPFTLLGLLRDIRRNDGLSASDETELAAAIEAVERAYFAADEDPAPELARLAEDWVARAN